MFPSASQYVVLSKSLETPTISTLFFAKTDGSIPPYKPGQCVTVYFHDLSPTLGKQYSISSAPCEEVFAITVKAMGRFSNRLCSLEIGDTFFASEPSGDFYPKSERAIVMLAGGMGVTPFRSIIIHTLTQSPVRQMALFYSGKTRGDMPFFDELSGLSKAHTSLFVDRFVTRNPVPSSTMKCRRMRFDDISNVIEADTTLEFLISGSLSFVLSQRTALAEHGISRSDILMESYF